MLKKTHKSSTAKGPGPCESNSEATASHPQRTRVRQLNLSTSLLNRLANSKPSNSVHSFPSPYSSLKLIDITRDHSLLQHKSSSSLAHDISGTNSPHSLEHSGLAPLHNELGSSYPTPAPNSQDSFRMAQRCSLSPSAARLDFSLPRHSGPTIAPSASFPIQSPSFPLLTPSTPCLLQLPSSGPPVASPTSCLLPLPTTGPLVASPTSRLLPHPSSGPLVASPTSHLLPHPSSGPLVASPTSRLLPPSSSGPPVASPIGALAPSPPSPSEDPLLGSSTSSLPFLSDSLTLTDPFLLLATASTALPSPVVPPIRKVTPISPSEIKRLLSGKRIKDDWFPGLRIEKHFESGLSRFSVQVSRACKRGSVNLGLFLRDDESPIPPSTLIGYYT